MFLSCIVLRAHSPQLHDGQGPSQNESTAKNRPIYQFNELQQRCHKLVFTPSIAQSTPAGSATAELSSDCLQSCTHQWISISTLTLVRRAAEAVHTHTHTHTHTHYTEIDGTLYITRYLMTLMSCYPFSLLHHWNWRLLAFGVRRLTLYVIFGREILKELSVIHVLKWSRLIVLHAWLNVHHLAYIGYMIHL